MNTFSPVSIGSKVENIILSEHTWRVAPVSIHHSLGFDPTKFTSEITTVKFTISLRQIRLLRWCFEIPRAFVSQDKTGIEWSTKALCRHSGELMMCLHYHRQKDEGRKKLRLDNLFLTVTPEIPRQPLYKGETRPFGMPNLLASQTLRIPK